MNSSENRTRSHFHGSEPAGRVPAALTAILTAALLAPAAAAEPHRALGRDGEVYSLKVAPLEELIPDTGHDQPGNIALALDVTYADGSRGRFVAPGTETWRPESRPVLEVDPITGAALVIWQAGTPTGTTSLHFATFAAGSWTSADQLRRAGEPYFFTSPPRVLLTRDRMDIDLPVEGEGTEEGGTTTITLGRSVFHVLWIEDESDLVRYSPLVFVEGLYVGWNEILTLSSAVTLSHEGEPPAPDSGLGLLLDARVIEDGRSLAVTLTESFYQRMAVLRIGVQPMTIETLGDEVLAHILGAPDPSFPEGALEALADELGARLIIIGAKMNLNPAVTDYVAQRIGAWLLENGDGYADDLEGLGQAARTQTLELGGSVYGRMVMDPSHPGQEIPEIDLMDFLDSNGHREELAELVQLQVLSDVEIPQIGPDPRVFVSSDGRSLLVAWEDSEAASVRFLENHGRGWSEPLALPVAEGEEGEGLATEAIFELLRAKVR
ncbi:MAG: hypothetical protein MI919_37735 [Holophagales bacterium]|nr:hypothetical protein [Holophagales bacterium]